MDVKTLEIRLLPDQTFLLFLDFRLGRAASCSLLGALEQFCSLGVTEACEGEVWSNAGAGTLRPGVRLLRGPGRGGGGRGGGGRSRRWRRSGRSGGSRTVEETAAGHEVEERHQLTGGLRVTGHSGQEERPQGLDQGGHVRPGGLLGRRPGRLLGRSRRWPGRGLGLPLVVSAGVSVVTAEGPLLALGGHRHHDGGGRAEALHGGGQTDPGTVDDLCPGGSCGGPLGSLSRLAGHSAGSSGDAAPPTAGTDSGPVYLVTEQGEEPGHTGALAPLVQRDLLTLLRRLLGRLLLFLHLDVG